MKNTYSNNITDLTRKALRNGGYEEDSKELLKAEVVAVSQEAPARLKVLCNFTDGNGVVYLWLDSTKNWLADY